MHNNICIIHKPMTRNSYFPYILLHKTMTRLLIIKSEHTILGSRSDAGRLCLLTSLLHGLYFQTLKPLSDLSNLLSDSGECKQFKYRQGFIWWRQLLFSNLWNEKKRSSQQSTNFSLQTQADIKWAVIFLLHSYMF